MLDDIAVIPNNPRVKVGELVVIVRASEDNIEVIARGAVSNIQNNELLVEIDPKSITKFPKAKDFVVSLARLSEKKYEENFERPPSSIVPDVPDPYEPGYIQLDFGPNQGKLDSQSPNSANQYKSYQFNYMNTRLLWYFDFVWRYGIEYETSGGTVPVKGYNREEKPTKYTETTLSIHYRLLPVWKELRPTLKLVSKSTSFTTENDDEYVLSSNTSGLGLGVNFHYLFSENLLKSEAGFAWSFNKAYVDLVYFPSYSATDSGVTRGESSTGNALELKVGATFLFHIKAIPFLKRYSLDLSAGMSQSQFSFSGAPTNPSEVLTPVPEGGTYKENQNFVKIMVGLRMDDYVGKLLKPR